MGKYLVIDTNIKAYDVESLGYGTMTVGDIIDTLMDYDRDLPVYIHDTTSNYGVKFGVVYNGFSEEETNN